MTIKTHGRMFTDNSVGITQLNVTDGTDSQALVTDGSGALRFATVGAGGAVGSSVYVEDTRTGNGVLTTFSLSTAVPYEESIFVFIDGIAQPTTAYTLPTTTSITFSSAPITGVTIRICHLGIASSIADNGITGAKIAMGADAAGDVLYYNGTDYQRLGIGTSGQHLATNSGANAPEWATPATAGKVVKIWHVNSTSQFITNTRFTAGTAPNGTLPQSDEGLLVLNLPITASATGNKLLFNFHAMGGSTSTPSLAFALFRTTGPNASTNALFATAGHVNSSAFASWHTVESALTTTASNYQVRMALANNGNVTLNNFNENGASAHFSTAGKINLTAIEYIP